MTGVEGAQALTNDLHYEVGFEPQNRTLPTDSVSSRGATIREMVVSGATDEKCVVSVQDDTERLWLL